MATKKPKVTALTQKLATTIYIGQEPREQLESHVIDISNTLRRQVKASAFLQFLIDNYGKAAKEQLIKDTLKELK